MFFLSSTAIMAEPFQILFGEMKNIYDFFQKHKNILLSSGFHSKLKKFFKVQKKMFNEE